MSARRGVCARGDVIERRMLARRGLAGAALLLALAACGRRSAPPACVPGASATCACETGATGAQRCGPDGTFGPCRCAGASPSSATPAAQYARSMALWACVSPRLNAADGGGDCTRHDNDDERATTDVLARCYGPLFEQTVRECQRFYGYPPTGVIDP
jgi:hypothetical protein